MQSAEVAVLEMSLKSVLKKNCADAPEVVLRRIETTTGIAVGALDRSNFERFLEGVSAELQRSMEDWRVKFVIGVFRNLVAKHL